MGIVGLGLIGGSLGLELRSQRLRVLGVSRQEQVCEIALRRGIVDVASVNLSLLGEADVIFVCTPLHAIAAMVEKLVPYLSPGTIITDVGSVKAPVLREVMPLWPHFVGGHPMTGTAQQGVNAAQSGLFVNTPYVITPVEETPEDAVEEVGEIARSLGCQLYHCSPEKHDRAVAWISHLPLFVSAALLETCLGETDGEVLQLAQRFASSGFRDTSRVGGGNPVLGEAIAQYNREELLRSLYAYRHSLDGLINTIEQENWQQLNQQLQINEIERSKFL
ncbi:prephenate/arogenate dehydrogenase [Spirulina sp. CS-785/01]|nr:prephenate/arogenate dehydrogenase [Spirulina sp. CS-785/01]MDB9313502.1 prephenate/arogenate dehydrogenase [Spirulina sp. CS-785/01]